MELTKTGYKQTEVGLIPENWRLYLVNDLIELLTDYDANGSFSSVAENVKVYDYEQFAWYVRSTDLENNSKMSEVRYVDKESYAFLKKTALFGGELLFLKRGDIGNVYLFEMKTKYATVAPNLYLLKLNGISNSKYLFYYFTSNQGQLQLKKKNASSTLGALYKDDVKSIATALSDVDALISSLDKLITKKKAIKQGAMQELLTPPHKGGKRLPGFTGDWEEINLKDHIWFQEGPGVRKDQFKTIGVKLLNGTNIQNGKVILENTNRYISEEEAYGWYNHFLADAGDIIIACSGITVSKFEEKVSELEERHLPLCMNTSTMRFKMKTNKVDKNFFIHYLKSINFKGQIDGQATGSAQLNFGPLHVEKVKILLPEIREQREIATILTDIDNDILGYEEKRKKYLLLKQGMMQELLTGKTRLFWN
jgi:type I restriction enzyme S subunit